MMTNLNEAILRLREAARDVERLAEIEYDRWMEKEDAAEARNDELAMVHAQRQHERADTLMTAARDVLEEIR
jgi:xanthine dehydrogenase molybdopterin-binding subunit B